MGMVFKLAWRNLWRNRRRTVINMSAVGIGLILVILYAGLIDGLMGDARSQMRNVGMGHVEVYAPQYRARQSVGAYLEQPAAILARLKLPEGSRSNARVVVRGLLTSAHGARGVLVHGVDPVAEGAVSLYVTDIRQGQPLAADDDHGILIGQKLGERLKVRVGQKVRLMAQRTDGEMGADIFRVRGIFHSIAAGISQGRVIITVRAAQSLLGLPDSAHQIVIQLKHASDADAVAVAVRAELGPAFDVVTYGELLPVLKTLERTIDSVLLVIAVFVYLLVGLGIMNTMLMSVLERTREFGVMQAIGNRPGSIRALVIAESIWVATLSVAIGLTAGLALTGYWSTHPLSIYQAAGESFEMGGAYVSTSFRTLFSPLVGLRAAAFVYLITVAVALYPAWRVSQMHPADALRTA